MSQADLATAMGTNQPQISKWLKAGVPPQELKLLRSMARALSRPGSRVTIDYLVEDDQDGLPPLELPSDEYCVLSNYRALKALGVSDQQVVDWMVAMKLEVMKTETVDPPGKPPGGKIVAQPRKSGKKGQSS